MEKDRHNPQANSAQLKLEFLHGSDYCFLFFYALGIKLCGMNLASRNIFILYSIPEISLFSISYQGLNLRPKYMFKLLGKYPCLV